MNAILGGKVHILAVVMVLAAMFQPALAYPQFADWLSSKSGKQVSCNYCHLNDQGPAGAGPGQIGSLTEQQLSLMHTADSPVLNALGQCLLKHLGYEGLKDSLFEPQAILAAVKVCDKEVGGVSISSQMERINPGSVISFPTSHWDRYHLAQWAVVLFIGALVAFAAIVITVLVRGKKS